MGFAVHQFFSESINAVDLEFCEGVDSSTAILVHNTYQQAMLACLIVQNFKQSLSLYCLPERDPFAFGQVARYPLIAGYFFHENF